MNEVSSSPLAALGERYSSQTGVDDPASCGENLDLNLKLISEIAPSLCTDCGGYHLRYAVSRVSMPMTPINFDRMELAQIVGAKVRAAGENGRVDVTIGGAADTGILATCASPRHACRRTSSCCTASCGRYRPSFTRRF
jgi:hypothetical protein